jgi:hypothetical protein
MVKVVVNKQCKVVTENKQGKVVTVHVHKHHDVKIRGWLEFKVHSFLILALDG